MGTTASSFIIHTHTYIYIYIAKRSAMSSTASSSLKATAVAQHHQHQQQRVVVSSPQKRLRLSKKASSSLTSTAKRNVVRRRANAVSVRAQEGQKGEMAVNECVLAKLKRQLGPVDDAEHRRDGVHVGADARRRTFSLGQI